MKNKILTHLWLKMKNTIIAKEKIFAFSFALLCAGSVSAQYDCQIDGIYYSLDKDKVTARVTYRGGNLPKNFERYSGIITIPSTINYHGKKYIVTAIDAGAFRDCNKLTSINIPSSVITTNSFALSGIICAACT